MVITQQMLDDNFIEMSDTKFFWYLTKVRNTLTDRGFADTVTDAEMQAVFTGARAGFNSNNVTQRILELRRLNS